MLENKVSINAVRLTYVAEGKGESVLFVHGSNADHRVWDAHRGLMVPHCRMISLTMRYFGTDEWPDKGENFSIQVLAEDLAMFIRSLKLESVTLVGWSLGAGVCLTMAVQNPGLIKRMFLYDPALTSFISDKKKVQEALADRIAMSKQAGILAATGNLEGSVQQFVDSVNAQGGTFTGLAKDIQEMMVENARMLPLLFAGPPAPKVTQQDLQKLKLPVMIALGGQSRSFYRIVSHTAHALIPSSELKVVEDARHLLPVQKPEEFCRVVLNFLKRDVPV